MRLNFPLHPNAAVASQNTHFMRIRFEKDVESPGCHSDFDLGFAAWYLNRVNYSGIIRGGAIGGRKQTGAFKLDARFGKPSLIRNILASGSCAAASACIRWMPWTCWRRWCRKPGGTLQSFWIRHTSTSRRSSTGTVLARMITARLPGPCGISAFPGS